MVAPLSLHSDWYPIAVPSQAMKSVTVTNESRDGKLLELECVACHRHLGHVMINGSHAA
jgi:hypothetical protein